MANPAESCLFEAWEISTRRSPSKLLLLLVESEYVNYAVSTSRGPYKYIHTYVHMLVLLSEYMLYI